MTNRTSPTCIERPTAAAYLPPVLYVNGEYDQVNTINGNHHGDAMRAACPDLTMTNIPSAHWLPLEKKSELVQTIRALGSRSKSFDGVGEDFSGTTQSLPNSIHEQLSSEFSLL